MPVDHFPKRVQPAAYRLRSWAMTEAPALLFVAVFSIALGLSYFGVFGGYKAQIHPIEHITNQKFWASVWLSVGGVALLSVIVHCDRTRNAIFTTWSALMLLWGASYFIGWAANDFDRGVALSILYCSTPFLVAWSVWRGSRSELVVREVPHGFPHHAA